MDAVAQFVNDSLLTYDNNQYTSAVFLDLSNTFDTIGHKVLLSKLEYNGIILNSPYINKSVISTFFVVASLFLNLYARFMNTGPTE